MVAALSFMVGVGIEQLPLVFTHADAKPPTTLDHLDAHNHHIAAQPSHGLEYFFTRTPTHDSVS